MDSCQINHQLLEKLLDRLVVYIKNKIKKFSPHGETLNFRRIFMIKS